MKSLMDALFKLGKSFGDGIVCAIKEGINESSHYCPNCDQYIQDKK